MDRRALGKVLAPIERRLKLMVSRAVLKLVDPAYMMQRLQVEAFGGELLDDVEHWEPYGYTSHPLSGAEALVLNIGGVRGHAVAVAVGDRRFRMKGLQPGEVALYTDEGDVIWFKRGQLIEINSGGHVKVVAPLCTIDAPQTHITGNLQVDGNTDIVGNATVGGALIVAGAIVSQTSVADPAGTMASMRSVYNGHTHSDPQGGTTSVPNQSM